MKRLEFDILKQLEEKGYQAYVVGGYVRDFLLNKNTNDIDICTDCTGKELLAIFSGKINDYGSLNVKINELNIDITTFREEKDYEGRKPKQIIYTSDLKKDLLRRDFTINTICMDSKGKIIDLLNGISDLEKKVIRMVGDTELKIKEDPLRILRAIRFATILDFSIEDELDKLINKYGYLVEKLSYYRKKEEVSKILLSSNYKKGLQLLKKYKLDTYLHLSYTNVVYTTDLCGMWSQIEFAPHYPFTKNEKKNIVIIRKMIDGGVINHSILYTYGLYLSLVVGKILGIESKKIHEMYQSLPILKRSDLKITYLEIANILNKKPSKEVKKIEQILIEEVLKKKVMNTFEDLKKYLIDHQERWKKLC